MPVASMTRSPNAFTSRPTNGAMTRRMNAKALTTAPAAALPTPNSRANKGRAGRHQPEAERDHEGDADERTNLDRQSAQRPHADLLFLLSGCAAHPMSAAARTTESSAPPRHIARGSADNFAAERD